MDLSEESLPLSKVEFLQLANQIRQNTLFELHNSLSDLLTFSEIIVETFEFKHRLDQAIEQRYTVNYSIGYHFANEIITKLLGVLLDSQNSQSHSPGLNQKGIHLQRRQQQNQTADFRTRWMGMMKDFREISTESCVRYETFHDRLFKQESSGAESQENLIVGFLQREKIQFTEEEIDSESQLQDYLVE